MSPWNDDHSRYVKKVPWGWACYDGEVGPDGEFVGRIRFNVRDEEDAGRFLAGEEPVGPLGWQGVPDDVFTEIRDNPLCLTCGLPKADHTPSMTANCAVFDLSTNAPSDPPRTGSGAESAPGRESPPSTRPGAPIAPGVSVASVLMGWSNDVKRELEELGADGPVGSMIPYHLDPGTPAEDLVGLLVSLRGISGDEDSGLIGMLRDLSDDVAAALASIMDRKAETFAGLDVERHGGTTRKYTPQDREVLAKEVAHRAVGKLGEELIDLVSGETRPISEAAAVGGSAVANAFTKAFRLEPRAGALRALGLDPDLYSTAEPGRPGVVVRPHRDTVE